MTNAVRERAMRSLNFAKTTTSTYVSHARTTQTENHPLTTLQRTWEDLLDDNVQIILNKNLMPSKKKQLLG